MVMVENKGKRRKIQRFFVTIGIMESFYQTYCLLNFPIHSQIIGHHVYYALDDIPALKFISAAFYVSATIVAPFFTSIKECG